MLYDEEIIEKKAVKERHATSINVEDEDHHSHRKFITKSLLIILKILK